MKRVRQYASDFNAAMAQQRADGLHVFNAESIRKLDELANVIMTTSGSGRICIVFEGGPGKGHWRFDEIVFRLDSEDSHNS